LSLSTLPSKSMPKPPLICDCWCKLFYGFLM
jgi:hypothetical protein